MAKKIDMGKKSSVQDDLEKGVSGMSSEYGSKYGAWLFLLGVLLSLVVGVFASLDFVAENLPTLFGVLGLLGLIVGLLNVTAKESDSFLIATIALMLTVSTLTPVLALVLKVSSSLQPFTEAVGGLLGALGVFVAPAALIVGLRSIYHLASDR